MEENKKYMLSQKIKEVIMFLLISFLLSIVLIFVLSAIMCYTKIRENLIEPAIIFVSTCSIIFGSFLLGKKIKEKGIIYGGLLGILYMISIYSVSSVVEGDFSIGLESLIMISLGICSGMLGGILGVNIKN